MQKIKTNKAIAQIISYAFHPLLMATLAVVILFNSGHYLSVVNADIRDTIYSIFFILTFVLPALFIPVLFYFRIIPGLEIDVRKDRLLPLFSVIIIYSLAYYFMQRVNMPSILLKVIISSVAILIVCTVITFFWKISFHTMALGGLLGFVIYISIFSNLNVLFYGFLIIVASGFVASSRLFLERHNQWQVYGGFIIGLVVVYLVMLIF